MKFSADGSPIPETAAKLPTRRRIGFAASDVPLDDAPGGSHAVGAEHVERPNYRVGLGKGYAYGALTADPRDPRLRETEPSGMQKAYLVLSADERSRGFVRPLRRSYRHAGIRPRDPLRDLTPAERERYAGAGYVSYEAYGPGADALGRFYTAEQLKPPCGSSVTRMADALAETYARNPAFYGSTWCVGCKKHLPVEEFQWVDDGAAVGS